jgi:hypothetical protein
MFAKKKAPTYGSQYWNDHYKYALYPSMYHRKRILDVYLINQSLQIFPHKKRVSDVFLVKKRLNFFPQHLELIKRFMMLP